MTGKSGLFFNSRSAILAACLCSGAFAAPVQAQNLSNFEHIVLIIEENRTPDAMFHALCDVAKCGTTSKEYNIQTDNWLNNQSPTGTTSPVAVDLAAPHGMNHGFTAFEQLCDTKPGTRICQMDGEAIVGCQARTSVGGPPHSATCPTLPGYEYVDNSTGILDPYLTLVQQYGWANFMFQGSEGESWPAHQFLFSATSAPTEADDSQAIFSSEDPKGPVAGCTAPVGTVVQLIKPGLKERPQDRVYPCFEHTTLVDLFGAQSVSWSYYSAGCCGIWTAPDAINHICQPANGQCTGPLYANVKWPNTNFFTDLSACNLATVNWVTPTNETSDHPGINTGEGPSWVSSIVNAIGNSKCTDAQGRSYWQTTAILVLWDDWGGEYDHVPAPKDAGIEGDYQLGARVPFIFVSAYTPQGYIDNGRYSYGAIIRFIENNVGLQEGALGFADARSSTDLSTFYNFSNTPRTFQPISAPLDANYFLAHHSQQQGETDD